MEMVALKALRGLEMGDEMGDLADLESRSKGLLAMALRGLEAAVREDLAEGLLALVAAAETLLKRSLVMKVDSAAIEATGAEMAGALKGVYTDAAVENETQIWVCALAAAIASFPTTVKGESQALAARARLQAVLDEGGPADADVHVPLPEEAAILRLLREGDLV